MAEFTVEEFGEFLNGVVDQFNTAPFPEAMEAVTPLVLQKVRDNFNSSATPDGQNWPERKPRKGDDGHPLLIESGDMMQAAVGQGQGHLHLNAGRGLILGVDGQVIPYAAAQNFGYPPNNLPSREYYGINEETELACVDPIRDAVTEKVFR
jgi:phage gpG-like protein